MEAEALAREAAQKGAAKRAQQAEAHAAALVETVQVTRRVCRAAAPRVHAVVRRWGQAAGPQAGTACGLE
jgi:hypothetical protein